MLPVMFGLSILLLLAGAALMLLGYTRGKGEYDEIIEPLDEKDFKTKGLLCVGMYLQESIHPISMAPKSMRNLLYKYDSRVSSQIRELYGEKDKEDYCQIHSANKWVTALLVLIFMSVFALICCSNGELTNAAIFVVCAPVAFVGTPFLLDQELNTKIEERREKILMEFPEFVNKLILLVNAGSTITKAWEKIVADSESTSPLFKELRQCEAEIRSGKPEAAAYEDFARRCKVKEVIKFVSVIILNLRKGGSEIIPTLRAQADECWESRKATARRLGEKASSKLMAPMAIMLLGVIIVVALPAVLALMGM